MLRAISGVDIMTDEELKEKMNECGQLMHGIECAMADFEHMHKGINERIGELRDEIKEEILKRCSTQKSQCLEVRYAKGKTTWNGSLLEGLALAHPEINAAKKVGKPTVSFILPDEGWEDDGR